jgi:hypothetical protein
MTPRGAVTAELSRGGSGDRKVLAVSHERSGTHFLMNTLALNFGYVANPWINLDYELGINLYSQQSLCFFFMNKMHDASVLNIVKSHHQVEFFASILPYLIDQFHIFYIYRDPRDVMVSFWRYVRNHTRDEGPRVATVGQFMRAAPWGGMLRYQKKQVPSILERWKVHVQDWIETADRIASGRIILVRYEELHLDFDATVHRIGQRIGRVCAQPVRPDPHLDVVGPGAGGVGVHRDLFGRADSDLISTTVGDLMKQLQLP